MMSIERIKDNIRFNQNLINDYSSQIPKLESKIEELGMLKAKYDRLQGDFEGLQEARMRSLSNVQASPIQNQILVRYYDEMHGILTGADYNNALNGLTTAKETITSKISGLKNELATAEANLEYRIGRREYWEDELRKAQA